MPRSPPPHHEAQPCEADDEQGEGGWFGNGFRNVAIHDGPSGFANPASAHGDYDQDERVIALIAHGFGQENAADIVKERCTWLETTED